MNEPTGQMVEMGFYFGVSPSADAIERLVEATLSLGSRFSGEVLLREEAHARSSPFQSIYEGDVYERQVEKETLMALLRDPNIRLLKVGLWDAVHGVQETPDIATFGMISRRAMSCDERAVALVSNGGVYDDVSRHAEAKASGLICYSRFVRLCDTLNPVYAAILVEDFVPCMTDLRSGGGRSSFRNFWISKSPARDDVLMGVVEMYHDAHVENTVKGVYVSTWDVFNPVAAHIDVHEALRRSEKTASLLSSPPVRA